MLTHIPFIYINIIALSCFSLLFVTMVAAKKTPAIHAFIVILLNCIMWSGSSVLMRLQMWPGMNFWFYTSLVTLFLMEMLFYNFVVTFYKVRGKLALAFAIVGTMALIPGTVSGFFLSPPTPVVQANGSTVFLYNVNWHIIIPCIFFLIVIAMTAALFLKLMRTQGSHSPGLNVIIQGGLIMAVGNLAQVTIPNNIFPYDALSGIFFAIFLTAALYRKRLFQMTLLVSRSILMAGLGIVCVIASINLVVPLQNFAKQELYFSSDVASAFAALIFAAVIALTYSILRRLVDVLFIREQRQGRLVRQFTNDVSQTLNSTDVMEKLASAVLAEIPAECVYICQKDGASYAAKYCSDPLKLTNFSISATSPQIAYLKKNDGLLVVSEFQYSPLYLSIWEDEKALFHNMGISHIVAIKDTKSIIGLLLLRSGSKAKALNNNEIVYLETVCSVASIALKNAGLYEKMFQEARIDPLTGVYNYRYFAEKNTELFNLCKNDCLSLLFVDVDDFKLYNQLYGVGKGDEVLCRISKIICLCAKNHGEVFRTSGKVFAVLLPHADGHKAQMIAEDICRRVREINQTGSSRAHKKITVSIGICSAPYAASTAKELMDNADLATYNAKQAGKDQLSVFRSGISIPKRLSERTEPIIERIEQKEEGSLSAFDMISALTATIDAKDHYTYRHSRNVARYAANLAVAIGLNDEQVQTVYAAGLLHDIGKISIPEPILRKPDRLTDEEYAIMKGHVNNSIDMIRHLPNMDYLIPAAIGHHERWDGKGYPRGISGTEIPIHARCLAVADAFDAMVTDRPYRKGLPISRAIDEILRGAGTQFDPQLAQVFAQSIQDNEIPAFN